VKTVQVFAELARVAIKLIMLYNIKIKVILILEIQRSNCFMRKKIISSILGTCLAFGATAGISDNHSEAFTQKDFWIAVQNVLRMHSENYPIGSCDYALSVLEAARCDLHAVVADDEALCYLIDYLEPLGCRGLDQVEDYLDDAIELYTAVRSYIDFFSQQEWETENTDC